MQNRRNYYRILHLQQDSPVEIIESSYRTLMQTLRQHPDLGGDHWNASLINEARDVLTDSAQRAEYDRSLKTQRAIPKSTRSTANSSHPVNQYVNLSQDPVGSLCAFCKTPTTVSPANNPNATCANCHSPLFPVVSMTGENSCKRAVQRVQLRQFILVYSGWPLKTAIPGVLKNLSPKGLQFTCDIPLHLNQIIKIESQSFAAVGRVTNRIGEKRSEYTIGAEFLTLRFEQSSGTFVSAKA